jgi:hypothetical protein
MNELLPIVVALGFAAGFVFGWLATLLVFDLLVNRIVR